MKHPAAKARTVAKHAHHVKPAAAHHKKAATGHAQKHHKAAKHHAAAKKHKGTVVKRGLAPAADQVASCAAEALAASLRLSGLSVAPVDVLELYWHTASDPDAGASISETLEAASEFGLAGHRLAVVEERDVLQEWGRAGFGAQHRSELDALHLGQLDVLDDIAVALLDDHPPAAVPDLKADRCAVGGCDPALVLVHSPILGLAGVRLGAAAACDGLDGDCHAGRQFDGAVVADWRHEAHDGGLQHDRQAEKLAREDAPRTVLDIADCCPVPFGIAEAAHSLEGFSLGDASSGPSCTDILAEHFAKGRHALKSYMILGLELPEGLHTVFAEPRGWWSWGELWCPCEFPGAVVDEAWLVRWS